MSAVLALSALAIGLCVALVALVVARAIAAIPPEDRSWLDRPPAFVHWLWWPTRWIAHLGGARLPARLQQRTLARLRIAGLDYVMTPSQLLAHRVAAALTLGLVGATAAANLPGHGVSIGFVIGGAAGLLLALSWFNDRVQRQRSLLLKTLPFFLDLVTLCVEAGLNLTGAFQQAVAKGPAGPLRDGLQRVLRDIRAGKSRADALRELAERLDEPAIGYLVSAIIQAESMGMSLGPVLRAQAEQRRMERFALAEKKAMEAPVKLLLPLIAFIFPCTFLVLGFPIALKFMEMGL
ncbi:MAG: type II secretion system F family protein [Thauera phenolivorans]|uniref:Type II secretion system F family protein n=1 Tax=Thauera phenolivorans TaxID=1792543 RepID=A0A7X7R701_9RHOO|nr:type II secretion system F family protein [Thauera phenolivorans]NLF53650.1 type II secretion system F family protein [Thauera phenolivorans]